jgi:hypothetical protein
MKSKIYLIPGFLTLLILLISCEKFLQREFITDLTYKEATVSYTYSRSRLASVYTSLPIELLNIDGAMIASASDEAEHTLETSAVQKFNIGSWNAYSNPDDVWSASYKGIRKVNEFLISTDSINLDIYKLDPLPAQQAVYQSRLAEIKQWKYEARFLRAFFYFELVKRYGGVPIHTIAFSINDDFSNVQRNTLDSCIKFIVSECDSAASILPVTYGSGDLGRATKGAALALKSRVLLYAASDLFNTPSWAAGYSNPELISLTGDRTARWQAAANAAKAVIDLAGTGYKLVTSYSSLFGPTGFNNTEVIFCRRINATNTFEKANFPIGYDLGQSGTTPSQSLVDAYEVKVNSTTSVPFDWNNPAHAANPYATTGPTARDPRLAMSILTNNTTFSGRPVECWTGGRDGKGIINATKTGYYLKKYVNEGLNLLTNQTSVHSWIFFRYAEIFLNYAEALNEWQPGHADIKTYVDNVRKRTGVAMPVLPTGLSQVQMRDKIRNERRIEFAFEGHRFWDVRRWMTAPDVLSAPLKGVEITKTGSNFSYNVIQVENRVFEPKMYFYPIPQNEIYICPKLLQNPLW